MTSTQSDPWSIPRSGSGSGNRLGEDLASRTSARPASYVAGSFFSPVSGVYAGYGTSASSLSRSLRTTFPHIKTPNPCVERKLANTRRMSEEYRNDSHSAHGFHMVIPTEKSDISVAWAIVVANQYLIKCGKPLIKRSSSVITHFNVEDCKKSVGDFSSTYKIELELRDEEDGSNGGHMHRFSFIAKFLPLEDPLRMYVFETDIFRKESEMYFDVLPAIKGCLRFITRKKTVPHSPDAVAGHPDSKWTDIVDDVISECVYSSYNPDGVGVLVFKSCNDDGYLHNDNPEGFSLPQVLRIVKAMAKFHAAAKTLIKIRTLELVKQVYPCLKREMFTSETLLPEVHAHLATYSEFLQTVSSFPRGAAFRDISHESCVEMSGQFEKLKSLDLTHLLSGLCRSGPPQLTTIVHGELWENNILLAPDVCHVGDGVKVVDWKNAKIASGTLDLAFLLLSSTDHTLRTESLTHILRIYHQTYTSTYLELVPDAPELSFEELESDYHESLPYALLQSVIMYVLELQFIDCNLAKEKDDTKQDILAERLKMTEYRALNLFRNIDIGHINDVAVPPHAQVKDHHHHRHEIPLIKLNEDEEELRHDEDSDLELSDN